MVLCLVPSSSFLIHVQTQLPSQSLSPVGAIPANILKTSLMANQQQKNYHCQMMGGAMRPTPSSEVGGNVIQAMIHK